MAEMEGSVRSEWEAEQMQVINWVGGASKRPKTDAATSGWAAGWFRGILSSGGAEAGGMQNSALPHRV